MSHIDLSEFGNPIEWTGGPCPVDPDTIVVCELTGPDDKIGPMKARDVDWDHPTDPVTRYYYK